VEQALDAGHGRIVNAITVFRVCAATDVVFAVPRPDTGFVSGCSILEAAATLLRVHPPNPMADRIAELTVTGCAIDMVYNDGHAGERKRLEAEVIVPLSGVVEVRIV
jgi:hypothetical protein